MRRPFVPLACALLLAIAGCEEPTAPPVLSGSIGGVPFTVVSGSVLQPIQDGPIFADAAGAEVVLDSHPGALGMSDPRRLHLRTQFALQHAGTITLGAFGTTSDPFGPGTAVVIGRNQAQFEYAFYVDSLVFADSAFVPAPTAPNVEQWIVTEFYAEDVPGYGAGSGVAMWPLDDLAPTLGEDVLGCADGPAMSTAVLSGDRVAYSLRAAFIVAVEVLDTIVGPCV